MQAMIFAAGLGTRLKPLTDRMPKALVPICGRPLLDLVLEKLLKAGFDDIVINVHHHADQIEDYIRERKFTFPVPESLKIAISDERDLLRETGGGIRHARPLLTDPEGFLVHNVDIISDLDLKWFLSQRRADALATLLVSERQTSRYLLFDEEMRLRGWTNVQTGEVRSPYPDLNPQNCRRLAFSGIHFISGKVFDVMDEADARTPVFGEKFPIMDFYLREAARCPIYGVEAKNLHLADVGKMQTLKDAEELCSRLLF